VNLDRERRRLTRTTPPGLVVVSLAAAGLVASFMQTIVIPIQNDLPELLGAPRADTAWIVTITLLVAAVSTPIAGRLGDMFGKRRLALVSLGIMIVGSIVAAVVPGIAGLIIGRGLQGVGMGVVPLGISIMRDTLPERTLPSGIALMSATLGIGGAVGLPISAIVSENADWHLLFWMAAGLGVLCFVMMIALVPPSVLRTPGRFDVVGAIGLAIGLVGVLLAISRGNEWGWTSLPTLAWGLGGVVVLFVWGWYELRAPNPLADLRVAARPSVLITNLSSLFLSFGLFTFNIAVPQYLETPLETGAGLGLSLLETSLVLLPSGLMMLVLSPISGRLITRFGPKAILLSGAIVQAIGYIVLAIDMSTVWQALVVSVIIGSGMGLAFAAIPTIIMRSVPVTESAAANGINALMRSFGTTVAAAVVGAVLAALTAPFGGYDIPTDAAFTVTFLVGLVAAALSAVLGAFIPRHVHRPAGERTALPGAD